MVLALQPIGFSPHLILVADVGGAGDYHVGDEAMLEANLATLRRLLPDARATVVSAHRWAAADAAVTTLPGLGFPVRGEATDAERGLALDQMLATVREGRSGLTRRVAGPLADLVDAVRSSAGVLVSGGGNLHATWPELIYERAAIAEIARLLDRPVAFVGQTLGPELSPSQRDLVAPMLRRACWVGVRDLASAAFALALGVTPDRLDYQVDDALLLEPRPPSADESRRLPDLAGPPWIAITVHPFAAPTDDGVRRLADQLAAVARATGARLVFVPHQSAGEDHGSDERFSRELAAMLSPQTAAAVCPVMPARLVRWLTGQASLVISTRYHPLVFGLAAGVASLAIYADDYGRVKLQAALRHARQSDACLALAEAEEGALAPRALALWARRAAVRADLETCRARWQEQEARRWPRLLAALGLAAGAATDPARMDAWLLGHEPRALALDLAATLEEHRAATSAEAGRRRAELAWVSGTATWRLRSRLVSWRPLLALYRWIRRLRR